MQPLTHKIQYANKIYKRFRYYGKISPPKYVIREDLRLLYLPISKAGNSSIKKAMFQTHVEIEDDNSIHGNRDGIIRSYEFKNKWKNYFKFTFVRNPFERLVSCYTSKYHNDKKYNPSNLWFDNYLFGIIKKDNGFEAFANRVCQIPNKFADEHFISQHAQINNNNILQVDYIGKLENMKEDFEPIRSRYDLPALNHFNQSKKENWMNYYTLDLAQKVYTRYRKDIQIFGYQKEFNQLLVYLSLKLSNPKILTISTSLKHFSPLHPFI